MVTEKGYTCISLQVISIDTEVYLQMQQMR